MDSGPDSPAVLCLGDLGAVMPHTTSQGPIYVDDWKSRYELAVARAEQAEAEFAECREQLRLANIDSMNAEAELERLRAGLREMIEQTYHKSPVGRKHLEALLEPDDA